MIRVAICDDEEKMLKELHSKVLEGAHKVGVEVETFQYNQSKTAAKVISSKEELIDILLLDIDMPDFSGLQVAKMLRNAEVELLLLFVSSHEQYVFESIEYNPFRYIRKSEMDKEFMPAIKAAFTNILSRNEKLFVIKTDSGEARFQHLDIMYFEREARKVMIYLKDGREYSTRKNIRDLLDEFTDNSFLQIHSGCVVNVKYITEFSNYDITLENGKRLIVSRRRIKEVKDALFEFWRNKI